MHAVARNFMERFSAKVLKEFGEAFQYGIIKPDDNLMRFSEKHSAQFISHTSCLPMPFKNTADMRHPYVKYVISACDIDIREFNGDITVMEKQLY